MEINLAARKGGKLGNGDIGVRDCWDGDFPDWFLIGVLCRLPVKYVFRFKCVSKRWLAVISDPSFPRFYIARASASSAPRPWAILSYAVKVEGSDTFDALGLEVLGDVCSDAFKSGDCYVFPLPSSQEAYGHKHKILAVSNGLVLYGWLHESLSSLNHIAQYYICNPITKKWFSLPPPRRYFRWVSTGFITQVEGRTLTSFKVVRLDCVFDKSNVLNFETFSSETGRWVDFTVRSERAIEVAWRKLPIAFNGNLHWIDHELGIVAYDPYGNPEKSHIIGLPADKDNKKCNELACLCDVHQGRLKYFESSVTFQQPGFSCFSIWILDDYSTGDWHLLHRVNQSDVLFGNNLQRHVFSPPVPVCYHPFDSDIVFLGWESTIISYNIKKRSLEHHYQVQYQQKEIGRKFFWVGAFVLAFPQWPTLVPSSLSRGADD